MILRQCFFPKFDPIYLLSTNFYRVQSAMNSLPVRLFLSTAKVISHPWFKTVFQYSTPVVKSNRKTRRGTKAERYDFRSIRTVVTTNRALCAYQSSGRTSTHSNLILITLQCSSKVTVDSIDTLPIKTIIQPRPKDNYMQLKETVVKPNDVCVNQI